MLRPHRLGWRFCLAVVAQVSLAWVPVTHGIAHHEAAAGGVHDHDDLAVSPPSHGEHEHPDAALTRTDRLSIDGHLAIRVEAAPTWRTVDSGEIGPEHSTSPPRDAARAPPTERGPPAA